MKEVNLSWSQYQYQQKNGWPIFKKQKHGSKKFRRTDSSPQPGGEGATPSNNKRDGESQKRKPNKRTSDNKISERKKRGVRVNKKGNRGKVKKND